MKVICIKIADIVNDSSISLAAPALSRAVPRKDRHTAVTPVTETTSVEIDIPLVVEFTW